MKKHEHKPLVGSIRTTKKFLIVPKKLGHETKWMTTVLIKQQYRPQDYKNGRFVFKWKDISFLKK